jgi:hypothetical protein
MLGMACAQLADDGELVMCHYLHDFGDRVLGTADAHALADVLPALVRTLHHRDEEFLLEAWRPVAAGGAR